MNKIPPGQPEGKGCAEQAALPPEVLQYLNTAKAKGLSFFPEDAVQMMVLYLAPHTAAAAKEGVLNAEGRIAVLRLMAKAESLAAEMISKGSPSDFSHSFTACLQVVISTEADERLAGMAKKGLVQ